MRISVCAFTLCSILSACGNAEEPYKPVAAWAGARPSLPSPPSLSVVPLKNGDAYTVAGAIHALRSRVHEKEMTGQKITLIGTIVDSNLADAPACALHPTGVKDKPECTTDLPSFSIADTKDGEKAIKVLGWASNFANVYDGQISCRSGRKHRDDKLEVELPCPLPAIGSRVKITGEYGFSYRAAGGVASDPASGILTYASMETVEPASKAAVLGGGKK